MPKISIIGNYGINNLGDEAILHAILLSHSKMDFTVFSHNPNLTNKQYHVKSVFPLPFGLRSLLRGNFLRSFKTIQESDCIILGGGGLFTDEKMKAVYLWGWHFFWGKFFNKPIFIYANSIGPLNTKSAQWIVKKILQKADAITVRDLQSAELLQKLNINRFEITADPAFLTEQILEKSQIPKKRIAISLRQWIAYEKKYTEVLRQTVLKLEQEDYQVLLIPMQIEQDDDREILNKIKTAKSITVIPQTFSELIKILADCEFTIGMRLHFLIASALANTPFIALSYSQKTNSFTKEIEQQECLIPLEEISSEILNQKINYIKTNLQSLREKLNQAFLKQKEKAKLNKKFFEDFVYSKTK